MAGLICNHCGQALSGTEKFCPNCGAKVEIPQAAAEPVIGFAKPEEPVAPATPEPETEGEKKPEFHMDETFDWDLDGYPTGEKKTQDVEFNWGVEKTQKERPEIVVPEWSTAAPKVEREERQSLMDGLFDAPTSEAASDDATDLFGDAIEGAEDAPAVAIPVEETAAADILSEAGKAEGKRMDSFFASSAENESYQRTLDREFADLSTEESATKEEDALRNLAALAAFAKGSGDGVKENDTEFEQRVEESANEFLRMIELEKERADAALEEELNKNAAKTAAPAAEVPVAEAPVEMAPEVEETVATADASSNDDVEEVAETVAEAPAEAAPEAPAEETVAEDTIDEAATAEAVPEESGEEPEVAATETAIAEEVVEEAETEESAENAETAEVPADANAEEAPVEDAPAEDLAKTMLAEAVTANLTEAPTEEAVETVEEAIAEAEAPAAEPTDSFFRAAKNDTFAIPKAELKAAEEKAAAEAEAAKQAEEEAKEGRKDFGQIFEEEKKAEEEVPVKKHTGLKVLAVILIILIILELITIFLKYQMPDAAITIKIQSFYDLVYGTIYDFFHGIFG